MKRIIIAENRLLIAFDENNKFVYNAARTF